ncbi:MAG TPA: toxin-antitoxin system HicB family antitoxin [Rhizobiaceae bacterium]|nr:toxin-antitoxin system HicB family antitoxin [Rhizobiaceae bacterium]
MTVLTIRLPDEQHQKLQDLARRQGITLDSLFEEVASVVLDDADGQARFDARAARGNAARGLEILDNLDAVHAPESRQ